MKFADLTTSEQAERLLQKIEALRLEREKRNRGLEAPKGARVVRLDSRVKRTPGDDV